MNTEPVLFPAHVGRPVAPATEPVRSQMHIEVTAVALPGGLCLRLTRMGDDLVVANGYASVDPLRAIAAGLAFPIAMWPAIRQELDRLSEAT
jgi:hypothetical protein